MTVATLQRSPEAVDRLIARVLRRAHASSEALSAPGEARTILQLAHSFADELAIADPSFDRLQFVKEVTGDETIGHDAVS
jgi:hypothetical protein